MSGGTGLRGLMNALNVMNERDVAGDVIASSGKVIGPEAALALKVCELLMDALFDLF
jgi:hypothetical protein